MYSLETKTRLLFMLAVFPLFHIETSQLIRTANQQNGFSMELRNVGGCGNKCISGIFQRQFFFSVTFVFYAKYCNCRELT